MRRRRPRERPNLLAIDLDGTLVEPLGRVRPAVVAAIARAADAGVVTTLVTGRMFCGTAPFARLLNLRGRVICYQGAVVADAVTGRFEREVPLARAIALRVYTAAKANDYHVQLYRDDRFYVEELNRYTELYGRISGCEPIVVPSLPAAFEGRDSTKVNIVTDPERAAECADLMRDVCGDDAYVTRSNPEFVEILDPHVDKGRALRWLAEREGIALERILAIGDSYNDIPLLRSAGFAVAMGSAPPELQAEADAVVGDVRADGVAEAIDRFVLAPDSSERVAG